MVQKLNSKRYARIDKSRHEKELACFVKLQPWNVVKVLNVASNERQIVRQSDCSIDKIKSTGFDVLLLVFQVFPENGTSFCNS